jgi:hypothetical protein
LDDIFARAEQRGVKALEILERLELFRRWSRFGSSELVGAVRYGLAVRPDIDMEIYSENPRIEQGFEVMSEVARLPGIWKVRFSNELSGPDQGLYWGLRFRSEDGEVWKVDQWYLSQNHPQAHWGEKLAAAMERLLTSETRRAILEIKEATQGEPDVHGIDVYRSVMEGGARNLVMFRDWFPRHRTLGISLWLPERIN